MSEAKVGSISCCRTVNNKERLCEWYVSLNLLTIALIEDRYGGETSSCDVDFTCMNMSIGGCVLRDIETFKGPEA